MALSFSAESSSVPVGRKVWIRRARRSRRFAGVAVLSSLVLACVMVATGAGRGSGAGHAVFYAFLAVVALGGVALARRVASAGVWLDDDEIVIRNPLRTVRVEIEDVDRFVPGIARGIGNGTPCPVLYRRRGRAVAVWALGREGVVWRFWWYLRELQPLCEELNGVLRELRAPGAAAGA